MKKSIAEISAILAPDSLAAQIAQLWDNLNMNRRTWLDQKLELRNYLFATDTTTTTNKSLPWKNKTTLPKLTQIRDNLHANYSSALFPNDDWLKWEGHSQDAVVQGKAKAIEAYMKNKTREGGFREEINSLLYDYIDYGNAFYDVEWINDYTVDSETGEIIPGYTGPKLVRISPMDIVFNPLAHDFDSTYKIVRYVKTIGQIKEELDTMPELAYNAAILADAYSVRQSLSSYTPEDINKATAIEIDGFGSLSDYYQSNFCEILEFEGSIHSNADGTYMKNVYITVIDRTKVLRVSPMPSWLGKSSKGHVGWRQRPDNIYAMGPLDNLVGMQYRIDHLENLKADAMDLAVHPPIAITGNVEEFVYAPGAEIQVGEGGSIQELGKNLNGVISASNEISSLELKMEEMAGAPKQAMGIRTPGEKTAFEVQTLEMAASRIFQNRIGHFEMSLMEPALNRMLEVARRRMDAVDVARVMDDDLGVVEFMNITKEDITASGKLRPIGARHFAAQATLTQNFMGFMSSPVGQDPAVVVHISGKAVAKMMEDMLGIQKFALFGENIRVFENAQTQRLAQQAQENLQVEQATPIEPTNTPPPEESEQGQPAPQGV
jgi:hypothetical protein